MGSILPILASKASHRVRLLPPHLGRGGPLSLGMPQGGNWLIRGSSRAPEFVCGVIEESDGANERFGHGRRSGVAVDRKYDPAQMIGGSGAVSGRSGSHSSQHVAIAVILTLPRNDWKLSCQPGFDPTSERSNASHS